jgi:hypothetical protein
MVFWSCYKRMLAEYADNRSQQTVFWCDPDHEFLVNSRVSGISGNVLARDLFTLLGVGYCDLIALL